MLTSIKQSCASVIPRSDTGTFRDPTVACAEKMIFLDSRIKMVEKAAMDTDSQLANYILLGVTKGVSYTYLKSKLNISCCKDKYYELYRKFFWLLSKERE